MRWIALVVVAMNGCAYGVMRADREGSGDGGGADWQYETGGAAGASTTSAPLTTSTTTSTSTSTTTTTSTGPDGGTDAGPGSCDLQGDCINCANCSLSGQCSAEADGCFSSQDCNDFLDCLSACTDDTCANNCTTQYATGFKLYMIMSECAMCDACPVDCEAPNQGLCS